MQRIENESFAKYKARRAKANVAVKNINAATKGGSQSARQQLRNAIKGAGKKLGGYGASLMASFAKKNLTPARIVAHNMFLAARADRLDACPF